MVDQSVIAMRYARALLLHAGKLHQEQAVEQQARLLVRALRSHPALERILADPLIDDRCKIETIAAASGGALGAFGDFVRLVVERRRVELLLPMMRGFISLLHERQRLTDLLVATAVPIDKAAEARFAALVERISGRKALIHTRVNPDLVGGYLLRWDTWRLDNSVRGRLQRIEKELTR